MYFLQGPWETGTPLPLEQSRVPVLSVTMGPERNAPCSLLGFLD